MQSADVANVYEYTPDTPTTSTTTYSKEEHLKLDTGQVPPGSGLFQAQVQTKPVVVKNNPRQAALREKLVHAFKLNRKKQLTLERINKYNVKLMDEVKAPRVKASNCALMVINYTERNMDPLIPELWGRPRRNPYKESISADNKTGPNFSEAQEAAALNKGKTNASSDGCCVIM